VGALAGEGPDIRPIATMPGRAHDSKRDRMSPSPASGPVGSKHTSATTWRPRGESIEADWSRQGAGTFRTMQGRGLRVPRIGLFAGARHGENRARRGCYSTDAKKAWFVADLPSDAPDIGKHPSYNLCELDSRRNYRMGGLYELQRNVLRVDLATVKLRGYEREAQG